MTKPHILTTFRVVVETEGEVKDLGKYIEIRIHSLENNGGRVVNATALEVARSVMPPKMTLAEIAKAVELYHGRKGASDVAIKTIAPEPVAVPCAEDAIETIAKTFTGYLQTVGPIVDGIQTGNGHAVDGQPTLVNMDAISKIIEEEEANPHPLRGTAAAPLQEGEQ
jgi:hypothetical protein